MHLSMLSLRGGGGGTPGICGEFDFPEEFLDKIPTVGPQNLVKSDQISPPWGSNIHVQQVLLILTRGILVVNG